MPVLHAAGKALLYHSNPAFDSSRLFFLPPMPLQGGVAGLPSVSMLAGNNPILSQNYFRIRIAWRDLLIHGLPDKIEEYYDTGPQTWHNSILPNQSSFL